MSGSLFAAEVDEINVDENGAAQHGLVGVRLNLDNFSFKVLGAKQRIVLQRLFFQYLDDAGVKKLDRKSTRLNSSHVAISYAVFCLKKKILTVHCSILFQS